MLAGEGEAERSVYGSCVTLACSFPGPGRVHAGSAAYNLLIISAVCIISVPSGETRRISDFPVFAFTALFSLWSYAWLVIVYRIWTPNVITMAEALLTIAFEFVLVGVSYLLDAKPWQPRTELGDESRCAGDVGAQGDARESPPRSPRHRTQEEVGAGEYRRVVGVDVEACGRVMHIKGSQIHSAIEAEASEAGRATREKQKVR